MQKLTRSLVGIAATYAGVTVGKNYWNAIYSTMGERVAWWRGIKYTTIDTSTSTSEPISSIPQTTTEIDTIAGNTDVQKNLFQILWDQPDQSTYFANVPTKVDGHRYGFTSKKYILPFSTVSWLTGIGIIGVQRLLMRSFPNGIRELPVADANKIQAEFFKSGTLFDRSKLDPKFTIQGWTEGKTLQTAVSLGATSMVAMQGLPQVQFQSATSETITAAPILVKTLDQHVFAGSVLWIPMINLTTGEFRTSFIGAGQSPLVTLDAGNNLVAGSLWDVVTESAVYLAINYSDLNKTTPDFINNLDNPAVAKTVWSRLPVQTRRFRWLLEKADKETYYAIKSNALGQYYGYISTPTDKKGVDTLLNSSDLEAPDVPFATPEEMSSQKN